MKEVHEYLDAARHELDGSVDCRTAEYQVLDYLHRALSALTDEVAKRAIPAASTIQMAPSSRPLDAVATTGCKVSLP